MKIQVLVATMHQKDYNLLQKMNLQSEAIVVNQCDNDSIQDIEFNGYNIRWINSTERGLSRSRNMAIDNATGDICLLCDDDVTYVDNYVQIVEEAFTKLPQADIIAFNIVSLNSDTPRRDITTIRKTPNYRNFCSVRLGFRLQPMVSNNIRFNINFGAGSLYSSGEEAIMLRSARAKKLSLYEYPVTISEVDCGTSTWFNGYNEKYFYDTGALISTIYMKLKWPVMFYLALRHKPYSKISVFQMIHMMKAGIAGCKTEKTYAEYSKK